MSSFGVERNDLKICLYSYRQNFTPERQKEEEKEIVTAGVFIRAVSEDIFMGSSGLVESKLIAETIFIW